MGLKTATEHNAAIDALKVPTLTVVTGNAGTSDTSGTAEVMRVGGQPSVGAVNVHVTGGTVVSGAEVTVGTIERVNTIGTLEFGTVVTTLALNSGTITTIAAGTLNTLGTVAQVTAVNSVANLVKGTITKLEGGTLGEVTLVPTVTTVSNLTNGSVRLTVGTITTGSLTNLASLHTGTIQSVSEVVKGTTTLVSTVTTVANLTTGSIVVTSGTLGSVGALAQVHNAGTIQAGTVQINARPVTSVVSHGTLGTAGGSFFATVSAASGVGTNHWVSNVDIVMQSGTADVRVLAGTGIQGTGVIAAGQFPAGGGISKHFNPAFNAGANSELTYHFVGAGTAFIVVNYWKGT